MNVYVLFGGVGGSNCHIEVFEDSNDGLESAKNRKRDLIALNYAWPSLKINLFKIKGKDGK